MKISSFLYPEIVRRQLPRFAGYFALGFLIAVVVVYIVILYGRLASVIPLLSFVWLPCIVETLWGTLIVYLFYILNLNRFALTRWYEAAGLGFASVVFSWAGFFFHDHTAIEWLDCTNYFPVIPLAVFLAVQGVWIRMLTAR